MRVFVVRRVAISLISTRTPGRLARGALYGVHYHMARAMLARVAKSRMRGPCGSARRLALKSDHAHR